MSEWTTARRRKGVTSVVGAFVAALLLLPIGTASAQSSEVTRVQPTMDSTVAYAVAWSQATFADGAAPVALLARDDDFADSLASGVAQASLQAPLLLTNPDVLSPETGAELERLGTENVIILGGEDAVSAAVESEVEALGAETERIGGETRLETAILMAQRFLPSATAAVVVRAFGDESDNDPTQAFADALAVNSYAVQTMTPVLLTETAQLSAATAAYLEASAVEEIVVAGGTAAVSDAALGQIAGISVETKGPGAEVVVRRVAGTQRSATAVALSQDLGYATLAPNPAAPRVILVEGQDVNAWASGLPAGVQAGNGAAFVLANGDDLLSPTPEYLAGAGIPLVCGPGVSEAACTAAAAALAAS